MMDSKIREIILWVWRKGYAWSGNSEKEFQAIQAQAETELLAYFRGIVPKKRLKLGKNELTKEGIDFYIGWNAAIDEILKRLAPKE